MDTKTCQTCGQEYERKPNWGPEQWGKSKYCSRACFGKDYSRRMRKAPDRECAMCRKVFRPTHFGAKYCSTECAKVRFKDRRGPKSHAWKGGRYVDSNGYVHVNIPDDHPYASMRRNANYALEHRIVMAEKLGRPLSRQETVHHINGKRADNRPENLQLRRGRHGSGHCWVCVDCGSANVREQPI